MTPEKRNTLIMSILGVLLLISFIINIQQFLGNKAPTPTPLPNPTVAPSIMTTVLPQTPLPTPTATPIPTGTPQANSFSNSKLAITLQNGWIAQGLSDGSVNITNGNYILYINPSFKQVSGVEGARFDEISSGAPSADLVTVFHPATECTPAVTSTSVLYKRYDVYTNGSVNADLCKPTTDGTTRWYFSFYVKDSPYVTYKAGGTESYVITVAIKATALTGLPKQDDATLATRLTEVNKMVDTLLIK